MTHAKLLSIQTGRIRPFGDPAAADPFDRPWKSAIHKDAVQGPVALTATGLEGDQQADRRCHGGIEMAVLACAIEHYALWRETLGVADLAHGAFGENLTTQGLDETTVCIGDTYRIGPARLQVSQPRQPCSTLARRWKRKDLPALVTRRRNGGWYLRVLDEGAIEAGMAIELLERPHPEWNVARVFGLRNGLDRDPAALEALADCPALSPEWREIFAAAPSRAPREARP